MTDYNLPFVERLSLILILVSSTLCALGGSLPFTAGVASGGMLAWLNLVVLRRTMQALFAAQRAPRQAGLTALLVLKFAALAALFFFVLTRLPVDALGVIVGVSLPVAAILFEAGRVMLRRPATPGC